MALGTFTTQTGAQTYVGPVSGATFVVDSFGTWTVKQEQEDQHMGKLTLANGKELTIQTQRQGRERIVLAQKVSGSSKQWGDSVQLTEPEVIGLIDQLHLALIRLRNPEKK